MQRARQAISKALNEHFVQTLVIAALIIISTMLAIYFITYKPERFSGFGVLNQDKEAGPYPTTVPYGTELHLHTSVSNHEGTTTLYQVQVILGNASTVVDPIHGVIGGIILGQYQELVAAGLEWEQNITLQFNETHVGFKKIFFDLRVYDTTTATFIFKNQTLHLWIDILGP